MIIENNPKELAAMQKFHEGDRKEGLLLQEEFVAELEYANKDHCPCLKACRYHGNCKECVAITEHIRSMYPTVCVQCSTKRSGFFQNLQSIQSEMRLKFERKCYEERNQIFLSDKKYC